MSESDKMAESVYLDSLERGETDREFESSARRDFYKASILEKHY